MGIKEYCQEIIDTWMNAINQGRDLTASEKKYIMKLQDKAIAEELPINDGLTQEELEAENCSNMGIDIFGDMK